jgi:hypothetical protein
MVASENMRPSEVEQLAIQAKLNMRMGAEAFDRVFMGAEFTHAWQGTLFVKVRSEFIADQLERKHVALLAAVAEDILGERIAFVDIIARGADRFTN